MRKCRKRPGCDREHHPASDVALLGAPMPLGFSTARTGTHQVRSADAETTYRSSIPTRKAHRECRKVAQSGSVSGVFRASVHRWKLTVSGSRDLRRWSSGSCRRAGIGRVRGSRWIAGPVHSLLCPLSRHPPPVGSECPGAPGGRGGNPARTKGHGVRRTLNRVDHGLGIRDPGFPSGRPWQDGDPISRGVAGRSRRSTPYGEYTTCGRLFFAGSKPASADVPVSGQVAIQKKILAAQYRRALATRRVVGARFERHRGPRVGRTPRLCGPRATTAGSGFTGAPGHRPCDMDPEPKQWSPGLRAHRSPGEDGSLKRALRP
jgi:hypothetical protein